MSKAGNLRALGFDAAERAAQVLDEITKLARDEHCLILKDVEAAVRYTDGIFILNGEPFPELTEVPTAFDSRTRWRRADDQRRP
jgi:hypothetical protein